MEKICIGHVNETLMHYLYIQMRCFFSFFFQFYLNAKGIFDKCIPIYFKCNIILFSPKGYCYHSSSTRPLYFSILFIGVFGPRRPRKNKQANKQKIIREIAEKMVHI